jgi:penicillin-binding protein 1C
VKGLATKDFYGAGIVLGAVELSMEELSQLYLALARGGTWTTLKRVRGELDGPTKSLVSPEAAELTLSMLSANDSTLELWTTPRDTVKVAWKTGTSYAYRDAWTVGVAGRYVLAVWVGNFDGTPNPSFVGRSAAAPLFFDVIDGLRPKLNTPDGARHAPPVHLAEIEVCALSGKAPGPHCPHVVRTRVIPGVSPISTCDVHRVFHVDAKAGARRCAATPRTTDELFEVWPSDIARLFARAGLPRKAPPPLAEACDDDPLLSERPPRILSPQPDVTYHLRRDVPDQAHLPLLAHADGAAHALTWFAGTEVLGTVKPGESLEWAAPSGRHELRAVDDRGGVARVAVEVQWSE